MQVLAEQVAWVEERLHRLPGSHGLPEGNVGIAWAVFQRKREDAMMNAQRGWTSWEKISLAGAGLAAAVLVIALTVAPVSSVGGKPARYFPRGAFHCARA